MTHQEAVALIESGFGRGERWADLGAGSGTFTRALLDVVGPDGAVWAVDRDRRAIADLRAMSAAEGSRLSVVEGDFTNRLELSLLDGILLANALHFIADPAAVLRNLVRLVRPGGAVLLVEYDRRAGNPWVPYPIPPKLFHEMAHDVGLSMPEEIGRRRSRFQGEIYAAVARKPSHGDR